MKNKKIQENISSLMVINTSRVRRSENELAKLNQQRREMKKQIEDQEHKIYRIEKERANYKSQSLSEVTGKVFGIDKIYFTKQKLEEFDSRLSKENKKKEVLLKDLEKLVKQIEEQTLKLKGQIIKGEKLKELKLASF